jgi:hypothetical protein
MSASTPVRSQRLGQAQSKSQSGVGSEENDGKTHVTMRFDFLDHRPALVRLLV